MPTAKLIGCVVCELMDYADALSKLLARERSAARASCASVVGYLTPFTLPIIIVLPEFKQHCRIFLYRNQGPVGRIDSPRRPAIRPLHIRFGNRKSANRPLCDDQLE